MCFLYKPCSKFNSTKEVKHNNISFHSRLLPRKTNDKIFQKIQGALFWNHFGSFCPNLGKKEFIGKRALSAFKCSYHLTLRKKSEKTIDSFLRNMSN